MNDPLSVINYPRRASFTRMTNVSFLNRSTSINISDDDDDDVDDGYALPSRDLSVRDTPPPRAIFEKLPPHPSTRRRRQNIFEHTQNPHTRKQTIAQQQYELLSLLLIVSRTYLFFSDYPFGV